VEEREPNAIYFGLSLQFSISWHDICAACVISFETAEMTRMDGYGYTKDSWT
jgi:hypothetical protein